MEPPSPIPSPDDAHFFASYQRVLRGKDTIDNLIQVFQAIEEKLLTLSSSPTTPPTLTDHERRQLLDLPNAEDETNIIKRIGSSHSREALLSAAISNPDMLSDEELQLVSNAFWSDHNDDDNTTQEDSLADDFMLGAAANATEEEQERRINLAREAASSNHHELEAFEKATMALILRQRDHDNEKQRAYYRDQARLQNRLIPHVQWMETLSRRIRAEFPTRNVYWGYVAFLDAETQALGEERLDLFFSSMESILYGAMASNGACANLLDRSWRLLVLNVPDGVAGYDDFRRVFRSLMVTVTKAGEEDASSSLGYDDDLLLLLTTYGDEEGISAVDAVREAGGLLANTFLVIDKTCVESVLDQTFLDDMRVVTVDADFVADEKGDAEDKEHDDSTYQGWTWVRIEQLANRFYGARVGVEGGDGPRVRMDMIWKAAQASRNRAFVAMNPEVARVWTESTTMTGQERPFSRVE